MAPGVKFCFLNFIGVRGRFKNLPSLSATKKVGSERSSSKCLMKLKELPSLAEKTKKYIESLPISFIIDQTAPPLFSYPWLQKIGRMDIFSEKIENRSIENTHHSLFNSTKFDPIFRLPKKKKKKRLRKI